MVLLSESPAVAPSENGELVLFAVGELSLYQIWQKNLPDDWSGWYNQRAPGPPHGSATIARNGARRLELFYVGGMRNELLHIWQAELNGAWSEWYSHGSPEGLGLTGSPIVSMHRDGRLDVFAIGGGGSLWHKHQVAVDGGWPDFAPLGHPPDTALASSYNSRPSVAATADGRLYVFAVAGDGALWRISQAVRHAGFGTEWSAWTTMGAPPGRHFGDPGPNPGADTVAAAAAADGRLEVFAVADDGALWHIWQTAPNGPWSNWYSHGTGPHGSLDIVHPPAVTAAPDGRLELFVAGEFGHLMHKWQLAPNDGWSDWYSHGHPVGDGVSAPAIATAGDGRLELFTTTVEGALACMSQVAPNDGWSNWHAHGHP